MITLEPEPFTPANDSRIVYTLDGSEPDESSTAYAGPFEIHKSCVVRAKAFPSQGSRRSRTPALPSFTNSATYTLTDKEPTVEFHLASDGGSEFMEHDYPVVSLSHVSTHPVTVTYQACAGTATPRSDYVLQPGTLTLAPGEQHRCFYLHVINDTESEPDETIVLSLSNPVNAVLGEKTTYTYTIEDNDPAPNSSTGSEGFEAGNFSAVPWERDGDSPWQVTSTEKNSGSYSARAGSISDGQTSTLKLTRICKSGTISFYVKTSSEPFLDTLMFRIDGAVVDEWFGDTDWTEASYAVGAGSHTFEWSYVKDDSVTSGEDTAWLDDIMFP